MNKKNLFKYHRLAGIIFSIPLLLTVLTGIGFTIFDEILKQEEIGEFLIKIHTGEIFGLEKIYPLFVGTSLLVLIITGATMYFQTRPKRKPDKKVS